MHFNIIFDFGIHMQKEEDKFSEAGRMHFVLFARFGDFRKLTFDKMFLNSS